MPEFSGIAFSNLLKVSRPPAEAPIPTTGKRLSERVFTSCSASDTLLRIDPDCKNANQVLLKVILIYLSIGKAYIYKLPTFLIPPIDQKEYILCY